VVGLKRTEDRDVREARIGLRRFQVVTIRNTRGNIQGYGVVDVNLPLGDPNRVRQET
jgi:hypothetical protein